MPLSRIMYGFRKYRIWLFWWAMTALLSNAAPHAKADPRVDHDTAAVRAAKPAGDAGIAVLGDTMVGEHGIASWYGKHWRGRRSADGGRFDDRQLTAAHLWLPFATLARVTNLDNGRSVDVVVTDRGPYYGGRIIDLSARAAQVLGMRQSGVAPVAIVAQLTPPSLRAAVTEAW